MHAHALYPRLSPQLAPGFNLYIGRAEEISGTGLWLPQVEKQPGPVLFQ